ncbi:MAG: hypothetical protein PVS2B3_12160 [Steroidobacteraceae bacterium]
MKPAVGANQRRTAGARGGLGTLPAIMDRVILLLVLGALAVVVASLGSGLFHLARGGAGDSQRLARALTLRIAVSLALFALLMIAWYFGLISPHSMQGAAPR